MFIANYDARFIQLEVVVAIIGGILALLVDPSFFVLDNDMQKVWSLALDPYKFPPMTQMYLKYLISFLIVIRSFTLHITIAMYVFLLWPAVFAEKPNLILPWLTIATMRLCVDVLATLTGLYVCSGYGFFNILWIEFVCAQILEHGPFFYVWLTMSRYRSYLIAHAAKRRELMKERMYRIKHRRKPRRSYNSARKDSDDTDLLSRATLNTIIEHLSRRKRVMTTKSVDTLLEIIEKYKDDTEILSQLSALEHLEYEERQGVLPLKQELQTIKEEQSQQLVCPATPEKFQRTSMDEYSESAIEDNKSALMAETIDKILSTLESDQCLSEVEIETVLLDILNDGEESRIVTPSESTERRNIDEDKTS